MPILFGIPFALTVFGHSGKMPLARINQGVRGVDYKKAGVDIDAGNEFVRRIRPLVRSTFRPEVLTDIGGFGGLFRFDPKRYQDPILVSGTDGVGTKLRIASLMKRHG